MRKSGRDCACHNHHYANAGGRALPHTGDGNSSWGDQEMLLIIWFLALVAAGDVVSYLVGLLVEYEWGSYPSLVVFLAMYFVTLWVAWRIAVWLTRPKPASTSSGAA